MLYFISLYGKYTYLSHIGICDLTNFNVTIYGGALNLTAIHSYMIFSEIQKQQQITTFYILNINAWWSNTTTTHFIYTSSLLAPKDFCKVFVLNHKTNFYGVTLKTYIQSTILYWTTCVNMLSRIVFGIIIFR